MKEHPILFSGEMVKAILEERKTVTRRVIKPQPTGWNEQPSNDPAVWLWCLHGDMDFSEERRCPYGQPGDRLWVRETHYLWGHWEFVVEGKGGSNVGHYKFIADKEKGVMFPDNPPLVVCRGKEMVGWYKRPAIFMPRWASRITLEITAVRAERLQDITEEQAIKEGVVTEYSTEKGAVLPVSKLLRTNGSGTVFDSAYAEFYKLWQKINGKTYPWASNPFVWVVEFKRIENAN